MKQSLFLFSICALAVFNSCSLVPSSKSPATPVTVVVPNVGTSWTLQNTYLDSSNTVKKMDTSTRTVIATGMTVQGDTGVVMTVETYSSSKVSDTVYLRYLSDGDISRLSWPLLAPHIAPEWLTIPYSTHKAAPYGWAGKFSLLGYTQDTVATIASYLYPGSETVGATTYSASAIFDSTWENMTGPAKDSLTISSQANTFISSIGIFGNHAVNYKQINGKQAIREQQVLIGVNLK